MISRRPRTRWIESGLLLLGLIALAMWAISFFESRGFQANASGRLDTALRGVESPSSEPADVETAIFTGTPLPERPDRAAARVLRASGVLGKLEIPRLGISAIVAEGADLNTLRHAIGHIRSTALPGNPGNCALAGHRDTFLRGLGEVRGDDIIRVVTLNGTHSYRVEWGMVVNPHRVEVLDSTATPSLTLITCYPFNCIGHAPMRYVVRAREAN